MDIHFVLCNYNCCIFATYLGLEVVDWINLAQNRDRLLAFVNAVVNFHFYIKYGVVPHSDRLSIISY